MAMVNPRLDLNHGFIKNIKQRQHAFKKNEEEYQAHLVNVKRSVKRADSLGLHQPRKMRCEDPDHCTQHSQSIKRSNVRNLPLPEKPIEMASYYQGVDDSPVGFEPELINIDNIDVINYVESLQELLTKIIDEPSSLSARDQCQVAEAIINRAYEDPDGYHSQAAKLCNFILQKEYLASKAISIPRYTFRSHVIKHCKVLLSNSENMRQGPEGSIQIWMYYCSFVAEAFKIIKFHGVNLTELCNCVYKILKVLLSPPSIDNPEELELACIIFKECGPDLKIWGEKKMVDLVCQIRDIFLSSPAHREMLLPLIELHAADWQLSEEAINYYSKGE